MKPGVLIPTGFGLNCEAETAEAFAMAGGEPAVVHWTEMLTGRVMLRDFDILALVGGFSFGDHIGAAKVLHVMLRRQLGAALAAFVAGRKPIIGICNGFQLLLRLGLLPDGKLGPPAATLFLNDCGVYYDGWVTLAAETASPCIWTRGLNLLRLPVRHREGKFIPADEESLASLHRNRHIALRYCDARGLPADAFPQNPNGSVGSIAGLCDPSGAIFGLMPHPEAAILPEQTPDWVFELQMKRLPAVGPGLQILKNGIEYVQETKRT